jgi:hypothetical protein
MSAGRSLHVRCSTWDQVESFYTRKLRRGNLLSMKVPFHAELGTQVTLGLELPNQAVVAIDGLVQKASPVEGDSVKTWIEIELVGFTEAMLARIKEMMAGAAPPEEPAPPPLPPPPPRPRRPSPSPPPVAAELPADERELFMHLTGELRRLRKLAVHEVLDVDRDADADTIRLGWMRLVRRHHPDLVARHQAPAITHLAEELTILYNRAYDRLRAALVTEGRATSVGSALQQPAGWLVGFDDISSRGASGRISMPSDEEELAAASASIAADAPGAPGVPAVQIALGSAAGAAPSVAQGGEAFEIRARMMLSNGDADHAQEVLAAALCVYPRSRPLRSLYYVASALAALLKGERMLATSQLETALAHYEHCIEAAQILDYMKKNGEADQQELRRFFR